VSCSVLDVAFDEAFKEIIPLSKFKEHSQIAMMTSLRMLLINNLRSLGPHFPMNLKILYCRLPLSRFDILKIVPLDDMCNLSTFHVNNRFFLGYEAGPELMTVKH
jgi:hypothetical protein